MKRHLALFNILIFLISLFLTGCSGLLKRSEYVRPDVSIPEHWQSSDITGDTITKKENWWRDFNDPVLSGMIELALKTNNNLAAATIKLKKARLASKLTNTNLTPSISTSANSRLTKDLNDQTEVESSGGSISTSYELDLWGKLASARDVSEWEAEATECDRRSTALALIGTVATDYWTIAYLNEWIESVEASILNAERVMELVNVKYQAGAVPAMDIIQAQQTVAQQKAQFTELKQQRTEARNALSILFNQAPGNSISERERLPEEDLPRVHASIPARLLSQRPDLQAAELRLKSYLAKVDNTTASFYPDLTLTGTLGTSSNSLIEVTKNPYILLGTGISLPFIQWNTMKLEEEISKADYEEAVVNFRQTLYSALSDVENSLAARQNYSEEFKQLRESLNLAIKAEKLAEIRYRAGSSALMSWLDAQETRREAERAIATVHLYRLKNCMNLYLVFGGSMQTEMK